MRKEQFPAWQRWGLYSATPHGVFEASLETFSNTELSPSLIFRFFFFALVSQVAAGQRGLGQPPVPAQLRQKTAEVLKISLSC